MTHAKVPCAMCHHFHTEGYPKQAAIGWGRCTGFDVPTRPIAFMHATAESCVLFGAGDNVAARQSFLKKHREAA